MPELPDVTIYVEGLRERAVGRTLARVSIASPFLLRTVDPPIDAAEGRKVVEVRRLGKRVVMGLEDGLFLVIHLMIAGRLLWKGPGVRPRGKIELAAFGFGEGTLVLTEAGTQRRASLHVVAGEAGLRALDPGGVDVFEVDAAEFGRVVRSENRTLKRALTNPRTVNGIGNAYSDEILHAARLSPLKLTGAMTDEEVGQLLAAAREVLTKWTDALRAEFAGRFPGVGKVTAFRDGFAVHGRFGKACPVCGHKVQRIRYAENETNYCPTCQTGGRVLADRSMSRLLKKDWPRTVGEMEE